MTSMIFVRENSQKGMALILAIAFLAVLSILGAVVLDVSTRDLKDSTTFLPKRQAFYLADRAVEYSMNRDIIFSLSAGDPPVNLADTAHKTIIEKKIAGEKDSSELISGSVEFMPSDNLAMPDHLAELHGNDFGVVLYHVNVKSKAALNTRANVDASIVRLFKKDDDQIFRTSGGG